jgi:cardiolipin synthase (CMP-forming)
VTGRVLTAPNLLTLGRGLAAVPVAYAILNARFTLALALVFVAGLTDGLDGLLARKTGQTSDVGRLLDPIADKVLLATIFVVSSLPGHGFEPLPWWLCALAIARDVGIVGAAWAIYAATGFTGFTPTLLGKINTCLELFVVACFLSVRAFQLPEPLLAAAVYATAATILTSSIHYVFHVRRLLAEHFGRIGARVT